MVKRWERGNVPLTQEEFMGEEIWKDVVGYEGYYSVSSHGRVYSHSTGIYLKGKIDKDGYKEYALCVNRQRKYVRGHRLVALAFIPNPDNLPMVNHKDNVPDNNKSDNLEWCNNEYNQRHAYNGYVETSGKCLSNLNSEDFKEMIRLYTAGSSYKDIIEHFSLDCSRDDIGQVIAGKKHRDISGVTEDLRSQNNHESYTLTDEDVWDILTEHYLKGVTQGIICKTRGLLPSLVSRIVNGKRRADVFERFSGQYLQGDSLC